MFCPKCGTSNADGSKFCSSCGNPLPVPGASSANAHHVPAAPTKKPDAKKLVILGAAVLVVIILIANLFGGGNVSKNALVGRWYRQSSGDLRTVFWFQGSGVLTLYDEAGDFTSAKGDNGNGSHTVLAHWEISGNKVKLTFTEDKAMLVTSYFGGDEVEAELSDDDSVVTFHTKSGPDLTLQKYPEGS